MNIIRNICLTVLFVFSAIYLFSQARYFDERYITTQAYINPVLVNPGAVGNGEFHRLIGNYRSNWSSFPGAPKSYWLSYDGNVGNRIGLGGLILSDGNGDLKTTKGQGTISYTIDSPNNKIGFGLSGEFIQHLLAGSALSNPLNGQDDPEIANRLNGVRFFDVSFGVFGLYNNNITYGLVLPSLVSSRLDDSVSTFENEFGYIAHVGYLWDVDGYGMKLEPSIFIKQLNYVPLHIDLNLIGRFLDDKLLGGISYTIGADERFGFSIGTRVNALNFTYSYNVSRNQFQTYNNGGHEFSFKVDIGRNEKVDSMDGLEMIEEEKM